jgi:hypothetical protein
MAKSFSSSRLFGPLALVFLLAFTQQAGTLHAVSHLKASQTSQHDKHRPAEKACDKCLTFAALDGVAQDEDAKTPVPCGYGLFVAVNTTLAAVAVPSPYLTRAPPLRS